jgi:lysozyme
MWRLTELITQVQGGTMAETLKEMLIRHEGNEQYPYSDSVGKLTIGVGRNLTDRGLSVQERMYLLHNDIELAIEEVRKWIGDNKYYSLCDARKMVLCDMMFNLGWSKMQGFKKFHAAVLEGDYDKAAAEMKDSKWYRQVGHRAWELCQIMKTGVLIY